jgi:DNA-binding NarL/FixJ family response regulator
MNEIKIIIADDHPIFRSGLKGIIEKERNIVVVAEAETGTEALEKIKELKPTIAVLDLDMPEMDGFAVAGELQKLQLPVSIVILTMHKSEAYFNMAIDLGVRGFVVKDGAASEIVGCIKTVASGNQYFSPAVSAHLLKRAQRTSSFSHQAGISDLTATERRILFLLAELKTSKDIATELGVSTRTIENHRARICQKLGLQGSHALVKFALQHKDELS